MSPRSHILIFINIAAFQAFSAVSIVTHSVFDHHKSRKAHEIWVTFVYTAVPMDEPYKSPNIEACRFVKWFIGISWKCRSERRPTKTNGLWPCLGLRLAQVLGLGLIRDQFTKITQKCAQELRLHKLVDASSSFLGLTSSTRNALPNVPSGAHNSWF